MRIAVVAAATCLSLVGLSGAQDVEAAIKRLTNIPPQPLTSALQVLAKAHGFQIVYRSDLVSDVRTRGASGELTTDEALTELLSGTALVFKYLDDRTITITRQPAGRPSASRGTTKTAEGKPAQDSNGTRIATSTPAGGNSDGSSASFWNRFRLAQADQTTAADQSVDRSGNATNAKPGIEEIIVTAQKREERLQDVPVPVAVISAQALATNNQLRLKDYYNKVPGLSLAQTGDTGQPVVAIRGLVTGGQASGTVGYLVDDVPFGATLNPGTSSYAPEIDPSDLARVEVLRGPQGTLYGASSLGGLLKFVTVDPSTQHFSGRVQAGAISVEHGDDVGYSLRGSVNVPLSDTFAVRASGFTREDPGYVDNAQSGERDVNSTEGSGGRVAALWQPSEVFSLKLSALTQSVDRNGRDDIDRSLGSNPQHRTLRGTGTYDRKAEAYSATMTARLGRTDLVSITGYNVDEIEMVNSQAIFIAFADGTFPGMGSAAIPGASSANAVPIDTKRFTQEIRATLPLGERVQWLIGGFYTDEDFNIGFDAFINDAVTGATLDTMLLIDQPFSFEEYAAFTSFAVDVTDRFDVQIGGRFSENRQVFSTHREAPLAAIFYGSNPSDVAPVHAKDDSFTYLMTPRLKVSPNLMVYARFASGYRPGSSNANCHGTFPCEYDADTTKNYDVGVKGSFLDDALSYDASVYYIDWKNIQIPLFEGPLAYVDNVGAAKSQGLELSMQSRPARGLSLAGWVAWNDAEFKESLPAESGVQALAGDRLPYSSPFSANFTIEQEFPLWSTATGLLGGSVSYVGERRGEFKALTQVRGTFSAYTQLDLSAGLKYGAWNVYAFVNNVTDKRGILRDGADFSDLNLATYVQPRTVGLQLEYQFD